MSDNNVTDWKALAQFWQNKYQEQLLHFTQVITVMSRSAQADNVERQQQVQPAPASENGKAPAKVVAADKP